MQKLNIANSAEGKVDGTEAIFKLKIIYNKFK